ncbi:hypothetical protein V2J09_018010 [Rumex salicifolius]
MAIYHLPRKDTAISFLPSTLDPQSSALVLYLETRGSRIALTALSKMRLQKGGRDTGKNTETKREAKGQRRCFAREKNCFSPTKTKQSHPLGVTKTSVLVTKEACTGRGCLFAVTCVFSDDDEFSSNRNEAWYESLRGHLQCNTLSDVEGLCLTFASSHGSLDPIVAVKVYIYHN